MTYQCNKKQKSFSRFPGIQKIRRSSIAVAMLVGCTVFASNLNAGEPGREELNKVLQGQIALTTPELQEKVKGLSTDVCKMDYMAKSSDALVGEMVITSGLGGIFPKGLPVGKISRVKDVSGELFKEIEVTPSVDFSKLEEVLVIQPANSSGQESN